MFDIYAVRDDTIINANYNFGSGASMTSWSDASGSWSNGGDGVVYDGDSEANPLAQTVTLTAGWHHISSVAGGMTEGEYIVRVFRLANQDTVAEITVDTSDPENDAQFEAIAGDYQIALYATNDADGSVENVMLTQTEIRVPTVYNSAFSPTYEEMLANPIFYVDLGGWEDATNKWSGTNNLAVYDNSPGYVPLYQSVEITEAGLYRIGIEAETGSVITELFVEIDGYGDSIVEWHNGQREKFIYLVPSFYDVDITASGMTSGGVKLVSLMRVNRTSVPSAVNYRTITASSYVLPDDKLIIADATSGSVTVFLPPLEIVDGMELITLKSNSANSVTIDPYSTETINGSSTQTLTTQWTSLTMVATDDMWIITAST